MSNNLKIPTYNWNSQPTCKIVRASGSRESEQTRSSDVALLESPKGDSATIKMEEDGDLPGSPPHQFPEMWLPGRILHVTPRLLDLRLTEEVINVST